MIDEWAQQWGIPAVAVADLKHRIGVTPSAPPAPVGGASEAAGQSRIRALAPLRGMQLWRNNVGALIDARGVPVRFGLANDSKELNRVFKSADLIGISNEVITLADVGQPRGRFIALECKHAGWRYTGAEREVAQLAFIKVVNAYGGRAKFIISENEL